MRRLALDHLTAVDTNPVHLVEIARATGYDAVCLFLAAMPVLPLMPVFDCIADRPLRRELRAAFAATAIAFDLAYPFTLTGRSVIADYAPALDCVADLGGGMVNVLLYDRDPVRRMDGFAAFCDLAGSHGLAVAVEFYPPSQIASLGAAYDLAARLARPGRVGINVDLLHLMRSGGGAADLAEATDMIVYAQVCDGPAVAVDAAYEASAQRLLAGAGVFDMAGFLAALPPGCPVSIEIPRDDCVATLSAHDRAAQALASVQDHASQI